LVHIIYLLYDFYNYSNFVNVTEIDSYKNIVKYFGGMAQKIRTWEELFCTVCLVPILKKKT